MKLGIQYFVPETTLKRWASYKEERKRPKEPEHLDVACDENECIASYTVAMRPSNAASYSRKISVSLPRTLEYNTRFQAAIIAYMCEGDDPKRANGIRFGLNNSDWRIVRIVVDEFEKLGLKREKWNVRLELYYGFHEETTEKKWWSEKLGIPMQCFTNPTWFEGIKGMEKHNPHGRARIQRSSAIFAAIIDHTCEKVMHDLLRR
jgi:hypothetical protein